LNKAAKKAKEIFFEILPPFIFFFIIFTLMFVSKELILKRYGIATQSSTMAVVAALIVAKVVLITDRIPFLNLYPRKPLIYNVVLKTVVFSIATMILMSIEEMFRLSRTDGGFPAAWEQMTGDFAWSYFFLRQAWVFMFILLYCAGAELTRVIGREKVREIFLGKK
jgi:hypothetical protein